MNWDSWRSNLESVWEINEVRFVVLGAGLFALVSIAIYLALWARSLVIDEAPDTAEHLSDFQQMTTQGHLNRDEYNRVRRSLGKQVHRNMADSEVVRKADEEG